MSLHRISATTASAFDSLTARMARVRATFAGATTLPALGRAEQELATIASEAKSLRMMVRGERAQAAHREREDKARSARHA